MRVGGRRVHCGPHRAQGGRARGAGLTDPVRIRPGDRPVIGPLAAAELAWEDWAGTAGTHLVYADLDLLERAALARDLGGDASDQVSLVRAAWERWGRSAPEHLNGQFSFAVWSDDELTLVRDHFGLTPLVWGRTTGGVVAGGDIRVALRAPGISEDIDEDVLVTVTLEGHPRHWNTLGRTTFRDLDQVRPSHAVVVRPDGAASHRYWDPRAVPMLDISSPRDLVARLRDLLTAAVTECTPEAGLMAVHLSGGLDSSGIAAIAARLRRDAGAPPPLALSWSPGPEHGRTPEHDRAESVAVQEGLELVYAPGSVEDRIETTLRDRTREPSGMLGSELTPMRIASERGAAVVLSGWGGDELASFSGRGLIVRELARSFRWGPLAALVWREKRGWRTLASGLIRRPFANFSERAKMTLEERRQEMLENGSPWLRPDVVAGATLPPAEAGTRSARELICQLLERGHLGIRGVDWGLEAALHGIRYRYPLLDRRIVEFSLGVPTEAWLNRGGRRRWILADALEGIVPEEVRMGVKREEALNEWRVRVGEEAVARLREPLADLVATGRQAHLFDIPAIEGRLRAGEGGVGMASWLGVRR